MIKKEKKVFLGGTCNESNWREQLIKLLKIDYFNPVVENWNEEAQKQEIEEREKDDFVLYVITPKMAGFYSIAEVVDDSNKRPEKTVFCVLNTDFVSSGKRCLEDTKLITFNREYEHSLKAVKNLVERNGAKVCYSLEEVAVYLNTQ